MILHHIEPFQDFIKILTKILPAPGKAFFHENNASSSLLIWFRQNLVGKFWLPKYGDQEEFPLSGQEIESLRHYFHVNIFYPELLFFRLISTYILRGKLVYPFKKLDEWFYGCRFLRKYSYVQYVYAEPLN